MSDVEAKLTQVAHDARAVARRHAGALGEADYAALTAAFHRAESLAEAALRDAITQVDPRYRAELEEQLADEERHVAVFARWHPAEPEPIRLPRTRQRPEPVWFGMLLINEITGFCQFHMLAALLLGDARQAEVEAVARDEVVHIARLVRWLQPHRDRAAWPVIEAMVETFVERLEGRMSQFLPRRELGDLRGEMTAVIAGAIATLIPRG